MTNQDLIERLKALPPTAPVFQLYDGFADAKIEVVYVAKNGKVILTGFSEDVYEEGNRPVDAPDTTEVRDWHTPLF